MNSACSYGEERLASLLYEDGDETENIEMRNQLRARGLERVKKFSWEKTATRTLRVFDEIKSP